MNDKWRLGLHLMPPKGWLNDPNGLCQMNGEYHFFFQYSPDDVNGGLKCWGHYTSVDLLNWQFEGIALSPEKKFERRGVYSGSALIENGKMHIYYTGNVKLAGDYDYITNGRENNTVYVCSEDGRTFGEKKCLLTNVDYPEDVTCHVRDPKVVWGKSIGGISEKKYMFLGARTREDKGEVLVYESDDGLRWMHANTIAPDETFGYMWECPDAFQLGEQKILSISPQGVEQNGLDYQNLYQSGYYILEGQFCGTYILGKFKEWDRGFDFYAPQTFEDEFGRRLLVGWIGMPDVPAHRNPTVEYGWQNALTVPRQIRSIDGKVTQYPVEELKKLRKEERMLAPERYSEDMRNYDVEIVLKEDKDFKISVSDGMYLKYEKSSGVFELLFDKQKDLGYGRSSRGVRLFVCKEIRMLVDTSCIEVYLNRGEEVFTSRFYTESGKSSFKVEGAACEIKYWELEPMNVYYH